MDFKKVQLEMLHWEGECNNDERDPDFDGDEGYLLWYRRQATSEISVEVVDTSVDTLELYVLLDKESAGVEGPVS